MDLNDSPEIPDKAETSGIFRLPSWDPSTTEVHTSVPQVPTDTSELLQPYRHVKMHQYPLNRLRTQVLCESRGGRPGLPVLNSPYGLCGRKATLNRLRTQELCESRGGHPGP